MDGPASSGPQLIDSRSDQAAATHAADPTGATTPGRRRPGGRTGRSRSFAGGGVVGPLARRTRSDPIRPHATVWFPFPALNQNSSFPRYARVHPSTRERDSLLGLDRRRVKAGGCLSTASSALLLVPGVRARAAPQVAAGWPVSVHRAAIHSMMGDDDDADVCYLDASYQPAACTLVQIEPGRFPTEKIENTHDFVVS